MTASNLLLSTITGIISGLLVYLLTFHYQKKKNTDIYIESSKNVINITFFILDQYHELLISLKKFCSLGNHNFKEVGPSLSKLKSVFFPYIKNVNVSFDSARVLVFELKDKMSYLCTPSDITNFYFNEEKIRILYDSVRINSQKIFREDVSDLMIVVKEFYKQSPIEIVNQINLIISELTELCGLMEYRIANSAYFINYGFPIERIIEYSIWSNDKPLSIEDLLKRLEKTFYIYFTEKEFECAIENLLLKKSIKKLDTGYVKTGYSVGLSGRMIIKIGHKNRVRKN